MEDIKQRFVIFNRFSLFNLPFQIQDEEDGEWGKEIYKIGNEGFKKLNVVTDEWEVMERVSNALFTKPIRVYVEPIFVTDVDRFILTDMKARFNFVFRDNDNDLRFCDRKPDGFTYSGSSARIDTKGSYGGNVSLALPSVLSFIKLGDGMVYDIEELLDGETT